jgi:uncharacterized protein YndB with AHSA1/START domain
MFCGKSNNVRRNTIVEKTEFIYVTYISSTPEKVWEALTSPEITTRFWQHVNVSDWKPGSPWEHRRNGVQGDVLLAGQVVETQKPKRLVITWADPHDVEKPEKLTRVTFEIESMRGVVRLTVTHDRLEAGSSMLEGITEGWPKVLSSMKSFLESGNPLPSLW